MNIIEGLGNDMLSRLAEVTILLEKYKAEQESLKAEVMNAMRDNNVSNLNTNEVEITYIAPSERENFDSKKLKKEMPEIYDKYKRTSKISESLRIKTKTILNEGV